MTLYVGELAKVTMTAKDFDGNAFQDAVLPGLLVTLNIYNSTGTALITGTSMTYDLANKEWFYLWDTTSLAAGSYRIKTIIQDSNGHLSWEWLRYRFAKNPL